MKPVVTKTIAPIHGPALLDLVEAYMRLANGRSASDSVTITRVFEWRADETDRYGGGIQRLSSASAGITKASPKK
jgi:hypothetical protein